MALWLELPSRLIVGHDLAHPDDADGVVGATLRRALERPLAGPPRQPGRIRVESQEIAREVRAVAGSDIEVIVAPAPELDELFESLFESLSGKPFDESYLEDGRVPLEQAGRLFDAARYLWVAKPWEIAQAEQALRMDLPALGVEGACVSIIGGAGSTPGFLIFPSLEAFGSFLRASERPRQRGGFVDVGTSWLALELEHKSSLPPTMQQEIDRFGLEPAPGDRCPRVRSFDHDLVLKPLTAGDVEIVWRCAFGLSTFALRHGSVFGRVAFTPVSETSCGKDGVRIRFTAPYEAYDEFEEVPAGEEPEIFTLPDVGRNEPCPCGSGRKYKKCHWAVHKEQRAQFARAVACHDLDNRVLKKLVERAETLFDEAWWNACLRLYQVLEAAPHVVQAWSVYDAPFDGKTVAERCLEEFGSDAQAWIAAQQAAWFSVWEVLEVERGRSLTLQDLLTGERRRVIEREASTSLVARDALLGRIVDHRGLSLMCAVHTRALPPREAAGIVRRALKRLRRKSPPEPARLRDGEFSRYLIRSWERAVRAREARRTVVPGFHNTDGDPILFTTDHYVIAPGARRDVEARLAALPGVDPPRSDGEDGGWAFLGEVQKSGAGRTILGMLRISGTRLTIETNSITRADALRERVERACAGLLRHRAREHTDPVSSILRGHKTAPAEPPSPEERQVMLEFKRTHYAAWIDEPLPALDGRTPREAAGTAKGREALDLLLKEMENMEQRSAPETRFDFREIRRSLHLD